MHLKPLLLAFALLFFSYIARSQEVNKDTIKASFFLSVGLGYNFLHHGNDDNDVEHQLTTSNFSFPFNLYTGAGFELSTDQKTHIVLGTFIGYNESRFQMGGTSIVDNGKYTGIGEINIYELRVPIIIKYCLPRKFFAGGGIFYNGVLLNRGTVNLTENIYNKSDNLINKLFTSRKTDLNDNLGIVFQVGKYFNMNPVDCALEIEDNIFWGVYLFDDYRNIYRNNLSFSLDIYPHFSHGSAIIKMYTSE